MPVSPRSNVPRGTWGPGTHYFNVHFMDGTPSGLYFRIVRTNTTLQMERYDWDQRKWIVDGEMADYYIGFEPGAFHIPASEAPTEGQGRPS